jgi:23S rRNA C2498 (ribose-2'-O)-methylase RlmM
MVETMAMRRATLAFLAILFVTGAALPAAAAPWRHGVPRVTITAEGPGTLIALRYDAAHVHFVHTREALERVALADIDRDGAVDIVAAPRDGALMLWRNAGHGRFARVALPRGTLRLIARGPHIKHLQKADDGWQWGDDRHDAAMPRAPDVIGDVPIASVRVTTPVYLRPASFRRFSGRAPPVL